MHVWTHEEGKLPAITTKLVRHQSKGGEVQALHHSPTGRRSQPAFKPPQCFGSAAKCCHEGHFPRCTGTLRLSSGWSVTHRLMCTLGMQPCPHQAAPVQCQPKHSQSPTPTQMHLLQQQQTPFDPDPHTLTPALSKHTAPHGCSRMKKRANK
jgi:hypothetical protein